MSKYDVYISVDGGDYTVEEVVALLTMKMPDRLLNYVKYWHQQPDYNVFCCRLDDDQTHTKDGAFQRFFYLSQAIMGQHEPELNWALMMNKVNDEGKVINSVVRFSKKKGSWKLVDIMKKLIEKNSFVTYVGE